MQGHSGRRWRALLVIASMATGLLGLGPAAPVAEAQANGCPSVGTNFNAAGPFRVTTQWDSVTSFYFPSELGTQGCGTHPVIIWGNGTFTVPWFYDGLLRHWASHGFIVAAANTSNAGSGQEMLQGISTLEQANRNPSSPFNGHVDLDNIGASGHSQGAAGALRAANDPRVKTVFHIQGMGTAANVESALYLAGDQFTSQMEQGYNATNPSIPAAFADLANVNHLTTLGNAGPYRQVSTAWARWTLMGDTNAAGQFQGPNCGYCSNSLMRRYLTNDALQALDGGTGGSSRR
jgi:Chlorophyllase enzyme